MQAVSIHSQKTCYFCEKGIENKPQKCTGCFQAVYCNEECLNQGTPNHQLKCDDLRQRYITKQQEKFKKLLSNIEEIRPKSNTRWDENFLSKFLEIVKGLKKLNQTSKIQNITSGNETFFIKFMTSYIQNLLKSKPEILHNIIWDKINHVMIIKTQLVMARIGLVAQ